MTRRSLPARTLVLSLGAVAAIDLSAQRVSLTRVGSIPGPVEMVRVQGQYAYLSADRTFTIFDISDPAAPRRVSRYTLPEEIWSFRLAGSVAYVANNFAGLAIIDVSNPAAPSLRGSFKAPGQVKSAAAAGTKVVLADHFSGLDLVDVSNPSTPASLGSFFLEGYARDVVTSGSLAYAVDSPAGFYILDLSQPDGFDTPVSSVQSTKATGMRVRIDVSEPSAPVKLALITAGGFLHVYDVTNPAAPTVAALHRMSGPQGVSLAGTIAYVADGREGLQVLALSTPSKPAVVGSYETAAQARDVVLADRLVFVVTGMGRESSEVVILRQQ
jgi:hypothetical protein